MIRRTATAADGFMFRYAAAQDSRLSYRARGVLVAVLANSRTWRVDAEWIASEGREGREAILRALRELEDHGYLCRSVIRGPAGRLITSWEIADSPQVTPKAGNRTPVNRKPVSRGSVHRGSEDRTTANRTSEDRTPEDRTPEDRTTADRTTGSPTPSFQESPQGNPPPPTPSRATTPPAVDALVGVVRSALPRTTPPPGRPVLVRECTRLASLGWTPDRLRVELTGHDWTGARSGAVVVLLRGLDVPEARREPGQERPDWCGRCEETTRMDREPQTGLQRRCPSCHPLAGLPVARRAADEDGAALVDLARGVEIVRAQRRAAGA